MLNRAKTLSMFDHQFWRDPKTWPSDSPGYVFLAGAFREIGSATYRGGWVQPPHVNEPKEPEEPADDCVDEEAWDKYEQEDDRYEDACEKARANCENMWVNVVQMIAEACKAGSLAGAVRAKEGGKMIELEAHYWNTEDFAARFFRSDISFSYPFAKSRVDRSHWIYVTRDSLDKFLGKMPAIDLVAHPDTSEGSHQAGSNLSTGKHPRDHQAQAQREESAARIRAELEKIYADPVNDRPNMNEAWNLLKDKLPKARRSMTMVILREPQFANQRRNPGNQPKN
jgi:hypothetical protein